jgi:Methyltransferase domain
MSSHIQYYRYLAGSPDMHHMTGRGGDTASTRFTNSGILEALQLECTDSLLDIGCGDGSLLNDANGLVNRRVGVAPTEEERQKLQVSLPDVTFLRGEVNEIPVESASATKIVCNSVLILLGSEAEVGNALREISRVACEGALIFLGEIPEGDELSYFCKYRGNSVIGFVTYQLKRRGIRAFLSSVREVGSALVGPHTLVLNSARIYYSAPERFIEMAAENELHPVRYFKHRRLDRSGSVIESPLRYDYVFRKAGRLTHLASV